MIEKAKEAKYNNDKEELDKAAEEDKKAHQQQYENVIIKSLNKFELKEVASIPKTEAMNETQATNVFKGI